MSSSVTSFENSLHSMEPFEMTRTKPARIAAKLAIASTTAHRSATSLPLSSVVCAATLDIWLEIALIALVAATGATCLLAHLRTLSTTTTRI